MKTQPASAWKPWCLWPTSRHGWCINELKALTTIQPSNIKRPAMSNASPIWTLTRCSNWFQVGVKPSSGFNSKQNVQLVRKFQQAASCKISEESCCVVLRRHTPPSEIYHLKTHSKFQACCLSTLIQAARICSVMIPVKLLKVHMCSRGKCIRELAAVKSTSFPPQWLHDKAPLTWFACFFL